MFDDDIGLEEAVAFGTGYALYRHGQDRQTAQLLNGMAAIANNQQAQAIDVHVHLDEEDPNQEPVDFTDLISAPIPESFDDYIGQDPVKRQMMVRIASAIARDEPLDHVLLASGYPGIGKTTMARLTAKILGVRIIELVPPFNVHAIVKAAQKLDRKDILFIDEIHILANTGKRGAEFLLKILEERIAFIDGEAIPLPHFTLIGATTNKDMLPETVVQRFKIEPYFQPYTNPELTKITINFAWRLHALEWVDDMMAAWIARACLGTPRITEEMVMGARDLGLFLKRPAQPQELLDFLEVEQDGLGRKHIHYLTALYRFYGRVLKDDSVEYIAGENTMMGILREDKQGIARLERVLVERGLLNRTTRGRMLTEAGIERAIEFIEEGKGAGA